jgi:hypothetical protein
LAVAAHQARGDDVVFEVDLELAFLVEHQLQEVQQVAGIQRRGICPTAPARLVGPTMVTPFSTTTWSATVSGQLPPWAARGR